MNHLMPTNSKILAHKGLMNWMTSHPLQLIFNLVYKLDLNHTFRVIDYFENTDHCFLHPSE
jgi:hypothetical protein